MKLGQRRSESAVPALISIIENEDEDTKVRRSAARALVSIAEEHESARPQVAQTLINAIRNDDDKVVKWIAIDAFTVIPERSAVPALIEALQKEKSARSRLSAVNALVAIGDKSAAPALLTILRTEPNEYVRKWIVTAFDFIPPESAVPAFSDVLKNDKSKAVRERAAISLGLIGDKSAAPALIAGLDDLDVWVRYRCLLSLIELFPKPIGADNEVSLRYDAKGVLTSRSELNLKELNDRVDMWKEWWDRRERLRRQRERKKNG